MEISFFLCNFSYVHKLNICMWKFVIWFIRITSFHSWVNIQRDKFSPTKSISSITSLSTLWFWIFRYYQHAKLKALDIILYIWCFGVGTLILVRWHWNFFKSGVLIWLVSRIGCRIPAIKLQLLLPKVWVLNFKFLWRFHFTNLLMNDIQWWTTSSGRL